MEFLIRVITQDRGQLVFQDTEIVSDRITIGSATDQLIQLRASNIAREHAVITFASKHLNVVCLDKHRIQVNGKSVNRSRLRIGDELTLASHRIIMVKPASGFDAACELRVDEKLQEQAFESAYATRLSSTFLGKRFPSYVLSLLIIAGLFVWPLTTYWQRSMSASDAQNSVQNTQSMSERILSRADTTGGDILWSSGPLLPAHQLEIGDDCFVCHKAAFQRVQDSACESCHGGVADHFDGSRHAEFSLGEAQCQSCHKEHNEPESMVLSTDALCVDCHNETIKSASATQPNIERVTGFGGTEHPEFRLDFLLPTVRKKGTGAVIEWFHEYKDFPTTQKEVSNLKFPHDVHLNIDKVQTAENARSMVCSDCHTLKSDNEHFEKITMEKHCAQCHDLTFDEDDPNRQLPHGETQSVVQSIEEHFVRVYTDPNFKDVGKNRQRRRPGQLKTEEVCNNKPFDCAIARATNEANNQFTQRGCVTCHQVSDNHSSDIYARWMVLPVKISHNWYARAQFDHRSHLTQHGEGENKVCSNCHQALESAESADVLIPTLENCLRCHGDKRVDKKVTVNCISCHAFHSDKK